MFNVKIVNIISKIQTHGAQFNTLKEVNDWIAQCESAQAWGKSERWVQDTPMSPLSEEDKAKAIDFRDLEVMGDFVTEYLLPAEYQIEVVDISSEIAMEKAITKNINRMQFGQRLMAELAAKNQAALIAGTSTIQQVLAAEEKLAKVQRLLLNGSTSLALQELISLDIPELPADLKASFVIKMQEYLANEN